MEPTPVQAHFYEKYGEMGYSIAMVSEALYANGMGDHISQSELEGYDKEGKLSRLAKQAGLLRSTYTDGLVKRGGRPKYLIKESDIEILVEKMRIPLSSRDLVDALQNPDTETEEDMFFSRSDDEEDG